jgi:molybdopterin converting factor subunit 1
MTKGDVAHDYGGNRRALGLRWPGMALWAVPEMPRFGLAAPALHCLESREARSESRVRTAVQIRVLFFGLLKDLVGRSSDTLQLNEGARLEAVLQHYSRQFPRMAAMLPSLAISVNQEYATADALLQAGDEVALLPPVSGGTAGARSSEDDVRLVREPISSEAVIAALKAPEDGAIVTFDGIVRDNTRGRRTLYLNYEAYEAMALKQMRGLAKEARSRYGVRQVALVHRLGRLEIGETSVLIVVASAHRGPAFEACRWMIDTLKKTVPIWKKEYFEDGAVWADGEPFPEEIRQSPGTTEGSPASK